VKALGLPNLGVLAIKGLDILLELVEQNYVGFNENRADQLGEVFVLGD